MEGHDKYWGNILQGKEVGASKKLLKSKKRYNEHKNPLTPLSVGDIASL